MNAVDVGVIGCGTAGGALALLLARAGHRVTVYERVPAPGPVGAGVMIQPTGLAVLARLGLADDILARGARVAHLFVETDRRRAVLDIHYDALAPGLFGLGLHRAARAVTVAAGARSRGGHGLTRPLDAARMLHFSVA